jgi:hypothetical protein
MKTKKINSSGISIWGFIIGLAIFLSAMAIFKGEINSSFTAEMERRCTWVNENDYLMYGLKELRIVVLYFSALFIILSGIVEWKCRHR